MIEFKNYIKELQSEAIDNITEHSKRSALEILLKSIAIQTDDKIKILHEPRRKENYGSPDFLIYIDSSIIGYVENKKITENLDKTLKTPQIKKYRELSDNILLTNYIEFVWIKKDVIERETLCYQSDLENKRFKLDTSKAQKVSKLISKFVSQAPIGISTTKELALALAVRGKNLKTYLFDELERQAKEEHLGRLFGLFQTFKENVSNDLKLIEFADAYAQMLVYGLFLAKLNADTKEVTLRNAEEFIPQSFQLIRELVSFFDELEKDEYKETRWIIEETISIMNNLQLNEIQKSLSFANVETLHATSLQLQTDPYIYFYEDFLAAYDSKLRKAKGVYYTPPQVVFFIVSAINSILERDFSIILGLTDHKQVTLLDFATGTGTFITEVFRQVIDSISATSPASKELIIREHLLKNIFGFEYLIAPYTIAQLKLSQLLYEHNYKITDKERLQIYLTNTLEPASAKQNLFLPGLTEEGRLAKKVKENPVLVITGNPPYSISSSNTHPMILNLLNNYKKGLNERKINLDDDYIKFIRFAHDKIARFGQGVVAVITNNSFLDGITHRRMRESLLNDFDKIYIINLHGNSLKKEGDENVFDIRVGVAISIFIKTPKPLKNKEVYYFSTKNNELIKRQEKYDFLTNNGLNEIEFEKLKPEKPNFWFVKKDLTNKKQYKKGWKLNELFNIFSTGIQTHKDELSVQFSKSNYKDIIRDFLDLELHIIKQKYKLVESRDWKIEYAKTDIFRSVSKILERKILASKEIRKNEWNSILDRLLIKTHYKPFDYREIFNSKKSKGFIAYPRFNVMEHLIGVNKNIGLLSLKQHDDNKKFTYSFVSEYPIFDRTFINSKGYTYVFPLYIYSTNGNTDANGNGYLFKEKTKQDNFTLEFRNFIKTKYTNATKNNKQEISDLKKEIKALKKSIEKIKLDIEKEEVKVIIDTFNQTLEELSTTYENKKQRLIELEQQSKQNSFTPSAEQIFGYIYAILHSPTYRSKYAEFLKFDFPRIPFTKTLTKFQTLSKLGWELIQIHLLNEIPQGKDYDNLAVYTGSGENEVEKPKYTNKKLFINKEQYFDNIPEQVYEFKIGAYQVLHKYLKDRKGRKLSYNEIVNIENISKALKFTINHKELIDNETNSWI